MAPASARFKDLLVLCRPRDTPRYLRARLPKSRNSQRRRALFKLGLLVRCSYVWAQRSRDPRTFGLLLLHHIRRRRFLQCFIAVVRSDVQHGRRRRLLRANCTWRTIRVFERRARNAIQRVRSRGSTLRARARRSRPILRSSLRRHPRHLAVVTRDPPHLRHSLRLLHIRPHLHPRLALHYDQPHRPRVALRSDDHLLDGRPVKAQLDR